MHRFSLKHLHLKVFEVQTSGIKHGEFFKKDEKKKEEEKKRKNGGNLIWQMQNFVQFGGNLIWQFKAKSAKFFSCQNFFP